MAIKRILFPTDLSENSGNALYYAINLAGFINAGIILYHCYKPHDATDIITEEQDENENKLEKEYNHHLSEVIKYGRKINPLIQFDSIVLKGDITDHLNDIVKEREIDLILMSTKGAGKIKAFICGTYAAKVIEKVSCPVFIIPEFYNFESFKNILFPSEYYDSDIKNIEFLADIAAPFDATITIANIADKEMMLQVIVTDEFEKQVRNRVPYSKIEFKCLDDKNINECITNYAKEKDIDLIVMSTRHRNKFEKIYDHSLTKKMAYRTDIPLLAFHTEEIFEEQLTK